MTNWPWSFVLAHLAQTVVVGASSSFSGCFLGQKLVNFGKSSTYRTSALSISSVQEVNTYKYPSKFSGKLKWLLLDLRIFFILASSTHTMHYSMHFLDFGY